MTPFWLVLLLLAQPALLPVGAFVRGTPRYQSPAPLSLHTARFPFVHSTACTPLNASFVRPHLPIPQHLFALVKAGHGYVKVVGGTKVDNEPIEVEEW
jgi:hypothetical protein